MFRFLWDDNRSGAGAFLFESPQAIIRADTPAEVDHALEALSAAQRNGLYAAGFLSFDLGYVLSRKLTPLYRKAPDIPLLLFGLFAAPKPIQPNQAATNANTSFAISQITPQLSLEAYTEKFERIKAYIAAGDIYQLNLTFKAGFRFEGAPVAFYNALRERQRVPYGAFIETGDFSILSLSPELFLDITGDRIATRPMKGTAPRGETQAEDLALQKALAEDEKSRAENLMIIDLMRNDLSRIALPSSVEVPDLFTVETFETLHQMTSGVEALLPPDTDIGQVLRAIYPAGSITGAPKIRALEIIQQLEDNPRGLYTGVIGFFFFFFGCVFNVAIRTLLIDQNGIGEIGIGSGVVQDSRAISEYNECLLKLDFMKCPTRP